MSRSVVPTPFLRRVVWADAIVSGAVGLVMAVGAAPLEALTSLPAGLLAVAGLALLPYAAYLVWLATRPRVPAAAVWVPIALNLVWAVDCVALMSGLGPRPAELGLVFLGVQALTVGVFAELEFTGLRRADPRPA